MTSKKEHHLFMESLRQALPHYPSTDTLKTLRKPPFCDSEDDEAEINKIFDEIFGALSETDLDSQCAATADADT